MINKEKMPFILIMPDKIDETIDAIVNNVHIEQLKEMDFEQLEVNIKQFATIFENKVFRKIIKLKSKIDPRPSNIIKQEKNKKYSLTYKRESQITVKSILGDVEIPTYYYYNQKYNHAETYNPAGYTETDFISPGLKRLIAITSIHFSDKQSVDYLYQLFQINIGEKTLMNVRHKLSEEAENWQPKTRLKIKTTEDNTRFALGLDEGKVHIKSAEKNQETGKFDYNWMNVKLGVSYEFNEVGKKINSSLYTGTIASQLADFGGKELCELAGNEKFFYAKTKVTLSDGANGYENILKTIVPDAYHILDVIHSKDHLRNLARCLHPDISPGKISDDAQNLLNYLMKILLEKGPLNLLSEIELLEPKGKGSKSKKNIWQQEKEYIEKNQDRMDYPTYIKLNLPIGSGVIESAIKYVCNKRLKNNSACWLIESVRGLLKLRIIWFNNYFDDFWQFRSKKLKKQYELKTA